MSARNNKSNSSLVARQRLFSQIITVLKFYVINYEAPQFNLYKGLNTILYKSPNYFIIWKT